MTRRQSVSRLTFQSCDPSWGRGRATGNITDHLSSLDPSSLSLPVPLLSSTVQPPAKPQDTRLEGFAWKTLAFSSSLPMANPFRQQLCMPSPQAGRWWGRKNPPNSSHDARPQANRKAESNVHRSGETYRGADFLVSPKPNPSICSSGG